MKLRIFGLLIAIFTMFLSPFSVWLIDGGQAGRSDGVLDKSGLNDVAVEIYVTSTGEKKTLELEEYICGVLLAEVPRSFDAEAIKAISVAARGYTFRRMKSDEKHTSHFSADVCDDYTHCLGYVSLEDAKARWGAEAAEEFYEIIKNCVKETKGEILYYEDIIADTVFHAGSYGYTESAENIWGYEVPYLVSVKTPEEAFVSSAAFNGDELKDILEKEGVFCDLGDNESAWISEIDYDENGRVESVCIGNKSITGRRIREIFGLKSTSFDIIYENELFCFEVKGSGHGAGLSQYGSQALAEEGKGYLEILSHYYPNTELGLY